MHWENLNGNDDQTHLAVQLPRNSQITNSRNSVNNLGALSQSFEKARKWLSSQSKFLVFMCMISGSMHH